jgi:hypothetical protein
MLPDAAVWWVVTVLSTARPAAEAGQAPNASATPAQSAAKPAFLCGRR